MFTVLLFLFQVWQRRYFVLEWNEDTNAKPDLCTFIFNVQFPLVYVLCIIDKYRVNDCYNRYTCMTLKGISVSFQVCCSSREGCKVKVCSRSENWSAKQLQGQGGREGDLTQRTEVKERICKSWWLLGTPGEDPIRCGCCLRDPETH